MTVGMVITELQKLPFDTEVHIPTTMGLSDKPVSTINTEFVRTQSVVILE